MQFAVGGNQPLVRDGAALPDGQLDNAVHPRTAIGFKDGGKTMLLVTADGRQAPVLGVTLRQLARTFVALGAETALNLDGGGSTTMVARALGENAVTVRNSPSDGFERHDPNGVGVFVTPGNGVVDELIVTPEEPRVFPGLRRTLTVKAVDDHDTPVAAGDVSWTGAATASSTAPADASGKVTATAKSGAATEDDGRPRPRQAAGARAVHRAALVRRGGRVLRAHGARPGPRPPGLHDHGRARRPRPRLRPVAAEDRAGRRPAAPDAAQAGRHGPVGQGGRRGGQAPDHDRRRHRRTSTRSITPTRPTAGPPTARRRPRSSSRCRTAA